MCKISEDFSTFLTRSLHGEGAEKLPEFWKAS